MKKIIISSLAFSLMPLYASAEPLTVNIDFLNVRADNDNNAKVVKVLKKGDVVDGNPEEIKLGFIKVKLSTGETGYAGAKFLLKENGELALDPKKKSKKVAVKNTKKTPKEDEIVFLSDDEEETEKAVNKVKKEEKNTTKPLVKEKESKEKEKSVNKDLKTVKIEESNEETIFTHEESINTMKNNPEIEKVIAQIDKKLDENIKTLSKEQKEVNKKPLPVEKAKKDKKVEKDVTEVLPEDMAKNIKTKDKVLSKSLGAEQNLVLVEGEGLHRVNISLKDLNRITCNGNISDPIYSKDKEIEIVRGGDNDLFIKISPLQLTTGNKTEIKFNTYPRELYVECNKMMYNISLLPQEDLKSQTIVLKNSFADKSKAISFEKATTYEKTVVNELIKAAYKEEAPSGYTVKQGGIKHKFNELDMTLRYSYVGHTFVVEDWEIVSKLNNPIELEENTFIPLLKKPRAISLTVPKFSQAGEKGRLLVVRLND